MKCGSLTLYCQALLGLAIVLAGTVYIGLIYDHKKFIGQINVEENNYALNLDSHCTTFPCTVNSACQSRPIEHAFIVQLAEPILAKPGGTFKGMGYKITSSSTIKLLTYRLVFWSFYYYPQETIGFISESTTYPEQMIFSHKIQYVKGNLKQT